MMKRADADPDQCTVLTKLAHAFDVSRSTQIGKLTDANRLHRPVSSIIARSTGEIAQNPLFSPPSKRFKRAHVADEIRLLMDPLSQCAPTQESLISNRKATPTRQTPCRHPQDTKKSLSNKLSIDRNRRQTEKDQRRKPECVMYEIDSRLVMGLPSTQRGSVPDVQTEEKHEGKDVDTGLGPNGISPAYKRKRRRRPRKGRMSASDEKKHPQKDDNGQAVQPDVTTLRFPPKHRQPPSASLPDIRRCDSSSPSSTSSPVLSLKVVEDTQLCTSSNPSDATDLPAQREMLDEENSVEQPTDRRRETGYIEGNSSASACDAQIVGLKIRSKELMQQSSDGTMLESRLEESAGDASVMSGGMRKEPDAGDGTRTAAHALFADLRNELHVQNITKKPHFARRSGRLRHQVEWDERESMASVVPSDLSCPSVDKVFEILDQEASDELQTEEEYRQDSVMDISSSKTLSQKTNIPCSRQGKKIRQEEQVETEERPVQPARSSPNDSLREEITVQCGDRRDADRDPQKTDIRPVPEEDISDLDRVPATPQITINETLDCNARQSISPLAQQIASYRSTARTELLDGGDRDVNVAMRSPVVEKQMVHQCVNEKVVHKHVHRLTLPFSRSVARGGRRRRTTKALDELSGEEDTPDMASVSRRDARSSFSRNRRRSLPGEPQRSHSMRTRRQGLNSKAARNAPLAVIDLTQTSDDDIVQKRKEGSSEKNEVLESLMALQNMYIDDSKKSIADRPRCQYLTPLTEDDEELTKKLMTRASPEAKIVNIPRSGITLRGENFRRLHGTEWLDGEVINAYVFLINTRNDAVFGGLTSDERRGIPRTYMFNTYFYTRLSSGADGFDYPGVRAWTKRAKVDVLQLDMILFPINLGNHHWVLAGIDLENKEVLYWDSMYGSDRAALTSTLRRWLVEEARDKHGQQVADRLAVKWWKQENHRYRVRRVGSVPEALERSDAEVNRWVRIPRQTDGGSCGVFTARLADCLSMGIKVYFKQKDIPLMRRRMALDLFRGYVPL